MSVILLTSASGAPGVTTTTLGLACGWSRPAIAVEADAVGGSPMLAGYFKGFRPPSQSLVDLLLAHRNGLLAEQFPQSLIPIEHTSSAVLPGPRSHAQAHSALGLWGPLSMIWKALGLPHDEHQPTDVLIDAGRLGTQSYPEPLLGLADAILLLTRSDLPALAAAKQWATRAIENRREHPEEPPWAVVLIGPGRPYSAHEVASVLGLPVVASLRHDSRGAAKYSHGAPGRRATRLRADFSGAESAIRAMLSETERLLGRPDEHSARPGTPTHDSENLLPSASDMGLDDGASVSTTTQPMFLQAAPDQFRPVVASGSGYSGA